MNRFLLAIRAFFLVLFHQDIADRVAVAVLPAPGTVPAEVPGPTGTPASTSAPAAGTSAATRAPAAQPKPPAAPARSEALTLLATLQREARFIDFVQEPLGAYSDAQVGAAARDVHRHCGEVLGRIFALRPVIEAEEGSEVDLPGDVAVTRFHLVGNVGAQTRRGKLCHKGWEATQCQLPQWTGEEGARLVVAPAEVELR